MTVSGSGWRRVAWSFGWLAIGASLAAHGQWDYPYYIVQPKDPWELEKKKHANACAAQNLNPCPEFELPEGATFPALKLLAASGTPVTRKAGLFLTEVAGVFAQVGLREPDFEPEVTTDMGKSRWAFMHPLSGSFLGEYSEGACNAPPVAVSRLSLADRPWTDFELYDTAAHELFHAVQYRYPALEMSGEKRCQAGFEWFDEGTAEGVASFMSERNGFRLKSGRDLGLRPYDASLHYANSWQDDGVIARVLEVFGVNLIDCDSVQAPDTPEKCLERVEGQAREQMGYMTSSFWRFLMDRYSSLLESNDPERLHAISQVFLEEPGVASSSSEAQIAWVADQALFWGPFQHVYGEFVTEFASWPVEKHVYEPGFEKWLDLAFGGCQQVELTKEGKSDPVPLIVPLHPVSAQCFQVKVIGFEKQMIMLDAIAEATDADLVDQLVLGMAREERGGSEQYDCYSAAQKTGPGDFRCLLYAKTQKVIQPDGQKNVRTWRFDEPRLVEEATSTTTFVLANVKGEIPGAGGGGQYPGSTQKITDLKLTFALSTAEGSTRKSALLGVPTSRSPNRMIPNFSLPSEQANYGIHKKGPIETDYAMNMGVIEVAALGDSNAVLDTFTVMPIEPTAFGQTGPLMAMVMQGGFGAEAPGPAAATRSSHFCNPGGEQPSVGTITRSDDELLEISIDTPICEMSLENMSLCRNGCPKVDHLEADLTLAFGWRHFAENEIEDLVTPAVQLDIDRYHHEVFGDPLPYPTGGGAGSGGDGGGDGSDGDGSGADGTGTDICLCTCEEYEEIQRRTEDTGSSGMPDMEFMAKVMRCAFECVEEYRACGRGE